ncbi:MAG: Tad domain-containing protein [Chloroflexi bacterium]|nr:Tad domain-containing protein [Chloroflexota bacterium]
MKRLKELIKEQKGSVLIYITLSMVALLTFGAGVAEMGVMYENRRQLQNGVDGASLAGAKELLRMDLSTADRQALAINTALDYAQRNGISPDQVDAGYPQVLCVPGPYNDNCSPLSPYYYNGVKVSASRDLTLMVSGLLNSPAGHVQGVATAVIGPVLPTEGLWPWGVSNCSDWDNDPLTPDTCGVPEDVPIILKFSSPPGSPGNFFPLDFPNSSGAKDYGDSIKTGYGEEPGDYIKPSLPWCGTTNAPCTQVDDPHVQTETGNKVGDTRDGVDYLVSMAASSGQDNPASAWNEPLDQCTWPGAPKKPADLPPPYGTGISTPPPIDWVGNASSCYRVGIVPIIAQEWGSLGGKKPVDIIDWGAFYLIGRTTGPGGQLLVWGYFTDFAIVSGGNWSDTNTGLWAARLWE